MKTLELPAKNIEKEKTYLEALNSLYDFSFQLKTKTYIFGGLTLDVWENKFLRDHHDIDCLTVDLHTLRDNFRTLFEKSGYKTEDLDNGDFRALKGDLKMHMGHLKIEDETVEWTHNGEKGSIFFPKNWLSENSNQFYGTNVYTADPKFEYTIKVHPELMNPEWMPRDKDIVARRKLEQLLTERGVAMNSLINHMQSVNYG